MAMLVLNSCRWPAALVLALCCSTSVAALAAQEAPAPNAHQQAKGDFAFWAEMPDVAQVINDVQGKDEEDTAARQLAAYRLLNALVNANADRIGQLPWPPRERALYSAYTRLIYKRVRPNESGPRDRRIMAQSYRFDTDTAFTQPFLKRYFSQAALRDIEPIVTRIAADAQRVGAADAQLAASTDSIRAADSVAKELAARPFHAAPVPPGERRFAMAVNRWCHGTPADTGNPIVVEQAQREFSLRLAAIVRGVGPIADWSGILLNIKPGSQFSDPSVTISVDTVSSYRSGEVAEYVAIAGVTGTFTSRSPAYAVASRLQVGQRVFFSGRALEAASAHLSRGQAEQQPR